jgi:hypothetical protein
MSRPHTVAAWSVRRPPQQKLVLLALADLATETGEAWPTEGKLAMMTGLTDRETHAALIGLMSAGAIGRQRDPTRTIYRLNLVAA